MNMAHNNCQASCTNSDGSKLGLVCHYQFENGSSQFVFLDVENGSDAALDRSLSFCTESFVQILASSSGLILLSSYSGDQICYNVFNPLTKDSPLIPQPCIMGRVVGVGLAAFDEGQFEVVLVEEWSSKTNGLNLHIFSSDTGEWRTHYPTNISVPTLPEFGFQELSTLPVYSNGAIHWELGGHLLVYHVKGCHCELYELPTFSEDWSMQSYFRGCLCESGGYVYYCYTDYDGVHIWGLVKEHDRHGLLCAGFDIDLRRFRWRLVHGVSREVFNSKHQDSYGCFFDWKPYKIAPIAYSEQAQLIYLQLPGTVVSFNFDTRDLRSVCSYSYPDINFNCCSFLPSITSGLCNQLRERNLPASEEMELTLPIAEAENLSL